LISKLCALAPILVIGLSAGFVSGQGRVLGFRARFAQETDAMRRAQMMPKLGEAEFDEITRNVDAGELPEALAILKEYRDEIRSCEKGLDAKSIDAEKHPKGYKQMEISLRQSLRRLDDLLVSLTADEQLPFLEVRNDLNQLNRHLIHELFPN
jgi:hypothetical protein